MRALNIVLFSSGVSESNGLLITLKTMLEEKGYICSYWRDLFSNARDSQNIALLPMLLKKIPSFDFAVLICEGHDRALLRRGAELEEVFVMRDNVLFEIGLCVMALGLPRTILLTDGQVRLPDDLTGRDNRLALKHLCYRADDEESCAEAAVETLEYINSLRLAAQEMDSFIRQNRSTLSPVVIGAAASTACGYVTNFIFRVLEKISDGAVLDGETIMLSPEKVFLHVVLPVSYTDDIPQRAAAVSEELSVGYVPSARSRRAEFRYRQIGDELHIYDYPTTIVTSYQTAMMILELDADDYCDPGAQARFNAKELDLFESALRSLLSRDFVTSTSKLYFSGSELERVIRQLDSFVENRIFVERRDY